MSLRYRTHYALAYLKSINGKRMANLIRNKCTYYYELLTGKIADRGFPLSLSIEPTTSCNLQCPECPSGLRQFTRPRGMISMDTVKRIIDEFGEYLFYVTLYFQGEPLLHKGFEDIVGELKKARIVTATSTNGHYLDAARAEKIINSGLDRLIVSLDGTDAETYSTYRRGGDFELVISNLRRFIALRNRAGRGPMVELQFIVFKHNEHQIEEIKQLGKELGVDKLSLKTAQLYEFEEGNPLMPGKVKYSRYEEYAPGQYRIKSRLPNRCYRSWSGLVVTQNGGVVPCCFDKDAEHEFGNINEESYRAIKNKDDYLNFLKQIRKKRSAIAICRNCTEGL